MDSLDDYIARIEDLESKLSTLETQRVELETRLRKTENVLVRGSLNLNSLIYETVYDKTVSATGSLTTIFGPFDTSKQSKDSAGNQVIPHAFYLLSAFTTAAGRIVYYYGDNVSTTDIVVSIRRTVAATPTRFESYININNIGVTANVNVKVLKLIGVR